MRLTTLSPVWLRYSQKPDGRIRLTHVESITEAQGIMFLCPKCFLANKGTVGTHRVICWASDRGVPDDAMPKPGRWKLVGTSFDDLSLVAKSSSVLLMGGCCWHGFVTKGEVSII